MSTFLVYLSLSHKSKHSCDVCLMSIWFEVAELHILILSSNLQIFYLKNYTALLQCRVHPELAHIYRLSMVGYSAKLRKLLY
jgi:hypothetical protein